MVKHLLISSDPKGNEDTECCLGGGLDIFCSRFTGWFLDCVIVSQQAVSHMNIPLSGERDVCICQSASHQAPPQNNMVVAACQDTCSLQNPSFISTSQFAGCLFPHRKATADKKTRTAPGNSVAEDFATL